MSLTSDTRNPPSVQGFKDSQEYHFRRNIRDHIKRGPFSRGEREVVLAFINHWFQHRNGEKPFVHPGRKKLAKRAGVCIKTVSRCLDLLRQYEAIEAVSHLKGLHGNATEYTVSVIHLLDLCQLKKADLAVNGGTNVPTSGWDKMSRRNTSSSILSNQEKDNVVALRLRGAA